MKFGTTLIPDSLFDLARERMRQDGEFTPEDIRQHIISNGTEDLLAVCSIEKNWRIIAERVLRACIDELRDAGEIEQLRKGLWTRAG